MQFRKMTSANSGTTFTLRRRMNCPKTTQWSRRSSTPSCVKPHLELNLPLLIGLDLKLLPPLSKWTYKSNLQSLKVLSVSWLLNKIYSQKSKIMRKWLKSLQARLNNWLLYKNIHIWLRVVWVSKRRTSWTQATSSFNCFAKSCYSPNSTTSFRDPVKCLEWLKQRSQRFTIQALPSTTNQLLVATANCQKRSCTLILID